LAEVAINVAERRRPVWESERAIRPMKRVMPAEGKGPYLWCAWKEGRDGD